MSEQLGPNQAYLCLFQPVKSHVEAIGEMAHALMEADPRPSPNSRDSSSGKGGRYCVLRTAHCSIPYSIPYAIPYSIHYAIPNSSLIAERRVKSKAENALSLHTCRTHSLRSKSPAGTATPTVHWTDSTTGGCSPTRSSVRAAGSGR